MQTILSIIILGLLAYWIRKIYFTREEKFRRLRRKRGGEPYLLSQNMYFTIFTVCTAPIFLGSLSLFKYALWFLLILYLIFAGKIKMRLEVMTVAYMAFFLWLCYTMTYTTAPTDGMMMLIKYSLPMLFLWLGYSSLRSKTDLIVLLRVVNFVGCVYCCFIGGQGCKLMPWLYYGVLAGPFSTYAGFADFLVTIFIVPILLYWLTKDKKYIYCALWMILSTVLESVRTGMGGMLLVFAFAILLKNKWRAVPGLLMAGAVFVGTILFVPSVKEKFFGDNQNVSALDVATGEALSLDKIEMNNRDYMWERVLENCYKGKEVLGGGLGTSGRFVKNYAAETNGLEMMHNDYLQLLCDAGKVGIALLILFYLAVILKVFAHVAGRRSSSMVRATGIMALPSMAGIAFCMFFDNVVSNSMQSMVMPYIYLGFFLKALDMEKQENVEKKRPRTVQSHEGFTFTLGNYGHC